MKNPLIFGVRTVTMRGRKLAPLQGGLFLCDFQRFFPEDTRPVFTERFRNVPRASGAVRSGIWQVAFLSASTNSIHHVTHTTSDAPTIGALSAAKPAKTAHGIISPFSLTRISPCS